MSGSRLGRGRGGRLAVYGGCGVVIILLVFLYRTATSEMARLRELHVQCAHQQEALAAQLQVIFEYKVRLENSLAEEKASNSAAKNIRDKDRTELMQKFNSLKQDHQLLQTEQQDLKEECEKKDKLVLDYQTKAKDKAEALERFKSKFLAVSDEKTRLKKQNDELLNIIHNNNITVEHLRKEVFQLKRELQDTKASCKEMPVELSVTSKSSATMSQKKIENGGSQGGGIARPPPSSTKKKPEDMAKQVSRVKDESLIPQHASMNERDEDLLNEQFSKVRFAQKDGNVVPVGPKEQESNGNEIEEDDESPKQVLPPPNKNADDKDNNNNNNGGKGNDRFKSSSNNPMKNLAKPQDTLARPDSPNDLQDKPPLNPPAKDMATSSSMKSLTLEKLTNSTKSTAAVMVGGGSSASIDKPLPLPLPVARAASKVKLPMGVVPIPMIRDQKDAVADETGKVKKKTVDSANPESPKQQNAGKQENVPDWFRVQPGFQEIGDEPNHLGRLAGLEEGGREGEVGDEQYDGIDYYKEPHAKNNDIHIVEAEDEGEDEDDQLDYLNNNPRQDKHE